MNNIRADKSMTKKIPFAFFSCFIGMSWLLGKSYSIDNTLDAITGSRIQIIKSVIYVCVVSFLIFLCICALNYRLTVYVNKNKNYKALSSNKVICCVAVFLALAYLVPIIFCYPGNMCGDAWSSLNRFWSNNWNMNQPPAYTFLLGMLTEFGKNILGDTARGLYCYIIIQYILYIYAFTFAIYKGYKYSNSKLLLIVSTIIVGITPYFSNRVSLVMKDNIYSLFVLLFITELTEVTADVEKYLHDTRALVRMALSIIGIVLTRKNGAYIIWPVVIVSLAILISKFKGRYIDKGTLLRGVIMCFVPVLLAHSVNAVIKVHYRVQEGSIGIGETLSLPFQQTARYVLEYGDEVTEEERDAIDSVLDYENLAQLYNPLISDRVKATYKIDTATNRDLLNYFMIWGEMFFKHPFSYIRATTNQFYMLFYPFKPNDKIYIGFANAREELMDNLVTLSGLSLQEPYKEANDRLKQWYYFLYHAPVISVICQQAIYILLFLILLLFAIVKKYLKYIYVNVPMIFSLLIIFAGPALQGHPRYAFPILYSIIIFLPYYIWVHKVYMEHRK